MFAPKSARGPFHWAHVGFAPCDFVCLSKQAARDMDDAAAREWDSLSAARKKSK